MSHFRTEQEEINYFLEDFEGYCNEMISNIKLKAHNAVKKRLKYLLEIDLPYHISVIEKFNSHKQPLNKDCGH